ncbi:MAG TPA: serine/threonine-protein kinase [Polyangiaceae bacterium]|nr:serine/threonine-protein kinase [Polyangiaceae bacterium]
MKKLPFPIEQGTILLGKYRVERLIGQGGMAAVYLAHHELLQQDVAIKVLLPEVAIRPDMAARFVNEARAAVRLRDEHIAMVMDVGRLEDESAYIVLEYLEGHDLEETLESDGPLPWQHVVDYVLQALEAVAQAHSLGIVHRDLKPANLFLAKRHNGGTIVKVLDFGISKISNASNDMSVTSTKTMLGSPAFMSPEQLRSAKKVDLRTDIWAVGVIIYHLLTGAFPYEAESVGELFAAVLEQEPRAIRATRADVPVELEAAYRRCLSRNVDERFQSVADLAAALEPIASADAKMSIARIRKTLSVVASTSTTPMRAKTPSLAEVAPTLAVGTSTTASRASWSESVSTPKKSGGVPRGALIGGGVAVLAFIGVVGFVVSQRGSAPASATTSQTAAATVTAASVTTTAPVASTAAAATTAPEATTTTPPAQTAAFTTAVATHASPHASASASAAASARNGATAPPASAKNTDVLLMQRN